MILQALFTVEVHALTSCSFLSMQLDPAAITYCTSNSLFFRLLFARLRSHWYM